MFVREIGEVRTGGTTGNLRSNTRRTNICNHSNRRGHLHQRLGASLLSIQKQLLLMLQGCVMEKQLQQLSLPRPSLGQSLTPQLLIVFQGRKALLARGKCHFLG